MVAKTKTREEAAGDLSTDEMALALGLMKPADLLRVERFARARVVGLRPLEWEDLVNEAVSRALSGSRKCPRDVPVVAFLRQTVRSIAEEERRRRGQQAYPSTAIEEEHFLQLADTAPDPEEQVLARDSIQGLLDRFGNDAELIALGKGLELGETATEICRRVDLTPKQYDAARKRFKRIVNAWLAESE
jgi:DNA-directed RNA polymerase specialized sigma24 family protein